MHSGGLIRWDRPNDATHLARRQGRRRQTLAGWTCGREVAPMRFRADGLVAKIPRSRRWRVTAFGHRVMGASVRLRQLHFRAFYAEAA